MRNIVIVFLIFFLFSCNRDRLDVDVSAIEVKLNPERFDQLFFSNDAEHVKVELAALYPEHLAFINLYTEQIIRVGSLNEEGFQQHLGHFINDTVMTQVADTVLKKFDSLSKLNNSMEEGFRHYLYYYPENTLPRIYTMISGFNESIVVGEELLAISLDKYLGRNCVFYQYLGVPQFKRMNMYPDKMVPDLFMSIAMSSYPFISDKDNLLENILYQGKVLYFTEAMLPNMADSTIMGYTEEQLNWCRQNEAMMWTYLVERKFLYNNERLVLRKFIGDAPFTNDFTQDSPGRTGSWIGWQIIRSFMENNKAVTLDSLMRMSDAQGILAQSAYYPD